jgi:hypothetical protein
MLHDLKRKINVFVTQLQCVAVIQKNNVHPLTIPVNNIDTIPDRPRPSESMYLKRMNI